MQQDGGLHGPPVPPTPLGKEAKDKHVFPQNAGMNISARLRSTDHQIPKMETERRCDAPSASHDSRIRSQLAARGSQLAFGAEWPPATLLPLARAAVPERPPVCGAGRGTLPDLQHARRHARSLARLQSNRLLFFFFPPSLSFPTRFRGHESFSKRGH